MNSTDSQIPSVDTTTGAGTYRVLETFDDRANENLRKNVRRKTTIALQDYPELAAKTVTIGRLNPDEDAAARAQFHNLLTLYHTDRIPSLQTVYHELAHLAIFIRQERGEDVPLSSESFCSIVAISRMGSAAVDRDARDDISYLGEPTIPRAEWPETCQRALDYREEHGRNSHYIKRCKEWMGIIEA